MEGGCRNDNMAPLSGNVETKRKFAERLKKLREEKGLSLDQASKQMGISKHNLINYERRSSVPSFQRLIQLADFFECSLYYLVGREE